MIVFMKIRIALTEAERMELSQRAASRSGRADDGRRARLVLLLEAGHTWAQIRGKLDCTMRSLAAGASGFGGSGWGDCSVAMAGTARAS